MERPFLFRQGVDERPFLSVYTAYKILSKVLTPRKQESFSVRLVYSSKQKKRGLSSYNKPLFQIKNPTIYYLPIMYNNTKVNPFFKSSKETSRIFECVQYICINTTCKINQRYFSDTYLNVSQEVSQEISSGTCLVLKDKSNAYLCSRPLILVGSFFF